VQALKRGDIPSIGGLRSFVAAAQHGSFTSAARELNLSQGAVSRQIRELEGCLGIRLFARIRQRVVLTEAGKLYFSHVKKPLEDLAAASQKVTACSDGTSLNLAVLPTLAARWLMPRLPDFQREFPRIMIHLTTPQSPAEFCLEPFDVAVFHSSPGWPGMTAHHLMDMEMVAVCSPELNAKCAISAPADVAKFPLLHLMARPSRWADWMSEAGVALEAPLPGHSYQNSTMIAQAAVAGLGIALMPRALVEEELADHRLEVVGGNFLETMISYYLIVPETRVSSKVVQAFVRWLTMEARTWRSPKDRMPAAKKRHYDDPLNRVEISDRAYGSRGVAG
jgi:LysR family transcriptional regulator, glycine cleavage system transcriptional activator